MDWRPFIFRQTQSPIRTQTERLQHVPSQTWLASLTPWSSFAFFSSIKRRKEGHEVRKACVKIRKEDHEALLDFLMGPSFLSLRKEKKQKKLKPSTEGGEVWPGTSRIVESPDSLKLLASKYVPSQTWLASLTPWSSFASFLLSREEKKVMKSEKHVSRQEKKVMRSNFAF